PDRQPGAGGAFRSDVNQQSADRHNPDQRKIAESREQVVGARIEHQCEEIDACERQPAIAANGSGAGGERKTDFAALRDGARSLRSTFEKRSGAGRERESGFTALRDGARPLCPTTEKRSGAGLKRERDFTRPRDDARSFRPAVEKLSEPVLIIEIGSHPHRLYTRIVSRSAEFTGRRLIVGRGSLAARSV